MPTPVGSPGSGTSTSATLSFSVTVPAGADFLTVKLGLHGFTGSITSVVFNGSESMTQEHYQTSAGQDRRSAIFSLANPSITTANVVVTLSAAPSTAQVAVAQAWSGVGGVGNSNGVAFNANTTTHQLNLVTTEDGSTVVDALARGGGGSLTADGDNTGNEIADINTGNGEPRLACSYADIATATDTADMDWTGSFARQGSMCAIELLAAAAGSSPLLLLRHYYGG